MAIDCLPGRTRVAMLHGIEANEIIVGAYTSPEGICPMLAAHRAGGRTSLISFAQAWDRLAFRGVRKARARRATEHELLILRSHLEASLLADETPAGELAAARREHEELVARRQREAAEPVAGRQPEPEEKTVGATRPGDPDRSSELRHRPGWAWTRVARRYDDYERILHRVESERGMVDAAPAHRGAGVPAA
ncbi:MAG TPA: hypothetical protein VG325_17050 [Solirubrobacteraceae bacterium]|jgi:hypothetical protein|nr:hypothetical protein [Solirubrobacteraceae bacterium]